MARTQPHRRHPRTSPTGSVPPDWEAYGARFGQDGLFYLAEWRRGFTVHERRALFFECQQVRSLQAENRQLRRDLEALASRTLEL